MRRQSLGLFPNAFLKFLRFLLLSFEFGHKYRNASPSSRLALDVFEAILVNHEPFGHGNHFISALLLNEFAHGKIVDVEKAMPGIKSCNKVQHEFRSLAVLEHLFGSCKHGFMPLSCSVVGIRMGHDNSSALFGNSICVWCNDTLAHFYFFDQGEPGFVLEYSEEKLVGAAP